jgi:hypothetical protein
MLILHEWYSHAIPSTGTAASQRSLQPSVLVPMAAGTTTAAAPIQTGYPGWMTHAAQQGTLWCQPYMHVYTPPHTTAAHMIQIHSAHSSHTIQAWYHTRRYTHKQTHVGLPMFGAPAYPGAPAMMLQPAHTSTSSFQMLQPAPTAPTHIEREPRQRPRKRRHGKKKNRDDYTTGSSDSSSSSGTEHKKRSARKRLKKSNKEDRKKRHSRSKSDSKGKKKKRRKETDKRRRDAKSSSSSDSDSSSSSSCYD